MDNHNLTDHATNKRKNWTRRLARVYAVILSWPDSGKQNPESTAEVTGHDTASVLDSVTPNMSGAE